MAFDPEKKVRFQFEIQLEAVIGEREGLLEYLFSACLFGDHSGVQKVKCRTQGSRAAVYDLLLELSCHSDTNSQRVVTMVTPTHVAASKGLGGSWDTPKLQEKAANGFVGLKNLGATCYLNALLQQLFMNPWFRGKIYRMDLVPQEDSSLSQLQNLFATLSLSEKIAADPTPFVRTFKDWDVRRYFQIL